MWTEKGEAQVMRELIRWEWQGGWEKKEMKHKETEWKGAGERQEGGKKGEIENVNKMWKAIIVAEPNPPVENKMS